MQAAEARVAVRAAEIATKVALEAQAAAETVLAEIHAATQKDPSRGPAVVQPISMPVAATTPQPPAAPAPAPVNAMVQPAAVEESPVEAQTEAKEILPAVEEKPREPRRFFGVRWDPDLPRHPAELKPDVRRGAPTPNSIPGLNPPRCGGARLAMCCWSPHCPIRSMNNC